MDEGEIPVYMAVTQNYDGTMLFFFESGKVAKISMDAYATKTNRKKLLSAYSDKEPLFTAYYAPTDGEYLMSSSSGRKLLFHSGAIQTKSSKNAQGVAVMTLKRNARLLEVVPYQDGMLVKPHRYRSKTLPAAGALPTAEESGEQLML